MSRKTKQQLIASLDEFTTAYLVCALWASNDNSDASGGEPLIRTCSIADFTVAALQRAIADCANFRQMAIDNIDRRHWQIWTGSDTYSERDAGHDFWLTRNHHGTGFWDRDLGETGDALTKLAESFGECNAYLQGGKVGLE